MRFIKRIGFGLILGCSTASAQVMLGSYIPGDGYSTQEIRDFNAVMPKPLAFINLFTSFSHDWDHLYWQTSNIVDEGAMPLISWMPIDLDRPYDNILPEIALGLQDDYIDQWGAKLLAWVNQYPVDDKPKILLRYGHEFNGNWYSYGNSPAFFQASWQHIHDRFESAGINQHIEWVWSANNVSVDDFDNITVYYPGTDYVDWTSLDGYNFGSNYAWSEWESFEETFADSYLALVNNYPEKPILIAELGSAEETDIPDVNWGQFGDNSDANENKSAWIADMLVQLETKFPAVRAIALFNINKELGWSLTHEANSGLSSYIAGISSDYYTTDFLSTDYSDLNEPDTQSEIELAQPTELELAAIEAAKNYESVLADFESAKLRLTEANNLVEIAEAENDSYRASRAEAFALFQESSSRYISKRDEFLAKKRLLVDSKDDSIKSVAEMNKLKSVYLNAGGTVSSAQNQFKAKRDLYLTKRQELLDSRQEFTNAKADLVNAVATFEAAKEINLPDSLDYDLLKSDVEETRKKYLACLDAYLVLRAEFSVALSSFRDVRSELISSTEQRKISKTKYLASVGSFKQSRNSFLSALNEKNGNFKKLVEERKSYLVLRSKYMEMNEKYVISNAHLVAQKESCDEIQLEYQQLNQARLDAYQMLADANYLVSLEGNATHDGLIFDDGNNGNNGNSNNNNSNSNSNNGNNGNSSNNGQIEEDTEYSDYEESDSKSKAKVNVKSINKNRQIALAKSTKPSPMDSDRAAKRKQKYKNRSSQEKIDYKRGKMSVLEY